MVRSIGLKDYKEELDYIREERANLDLREVGTLKKIKELFNAEAKDFLNGGFKVIKIEKDAHRTIYGNVINTTKITIEKKKDIDSCK